MGFKPKKKPVVYKYIKDKAVPKEYSYCKGCKSLTRDKDVGMCSSSCCCDKFKCLNCGAVSYAEYD